MGRRAKSKQADPPTLEEFRGEKRTKPTELSRRAKKRAKQAEAGVSASKKSRKTGEDEELEEARADSFDSDEEVSAKPMFSDDEGDEDDLEKSNAATATKFLDESEEDEGEEGEEGDEFDDSEYDSFDEYGEDEEGEEKDEFEGISGEEGEEEGEGDDESLDDENLDEITSGPVSAPDSRIRIMETVKILENLTELGKRKPRSYYVSRLLADIQEYYGYSEYMAEKFFNLFNPAEAVEFFEACEVPRPVVIRTNTSKTTRRDLIQASTSRGANVQGLTWSKVGIQIFDSQVPVGATPEYSAGHYISQAASSFLPVMALNPKPTERVSDMASAPGGKTTYLAALMKDTGVVFANDSNKSRAKSLIANIHRLGCTNTIVSHYDAREFPKVIGGFDRVSLDAPCSGTGVVSKDPQVKTNRTEKDFVQLPHLQKQSSSSAIDSVDHHSEGATIVYSTCSVMPEENEAVVDYVLRKRPNVHLVETESPIGRPGFTSFRGKKFHPSLSMTRRYYPHTYNVDGFYVAKLKKTGPSPVVTPGEKEKEADLEEKSHEPFAEFESKDDTEIIEKSLKRSRRKRGKK